MSVVMGDLNTHLGRNAVKYSFHESSNNNGKLVHDFVEETRFSSPAQLFISDISGTKSHVA